MKEVWIAIISICIIVLFSLGGYLIFTSEQHGALYIVQDGVNVYICDGVLKTHGEKTMRHAFYCDTAR